MQRPAQAAPTNSRALYLNSLVWFMGIRPATPAKPARVMPRKRK